MKEFPRSVSKIGIVATARKVSSVDLEPCIALLKENEFEVVLSKNVFAADHQFAGTDELRLESFQQMLDDETVDAILFARGGYGTQRIIDNINWDTFNKFPKWLIGYSDLTAVHFSIFNKTKGCFIHAPMAIEFSKNSLKGDIQTLISFLKNTHQFECTVSSHELNVHGTAEGELIGGNLSLLNTTLGTADMPDFNSKILFLEEIDEYLYHIDRMLVHLKRTKKLGLLKGILVGSFHDIKDNQIPFGKDSYSIISDHFKEFQIPIAFNLPSGHGDRNFPLIFGKKVQLTINESGTKITF